ncbi:hypothetical protein BDW75DRAFT_92094 [Aspergillus navahoensis]
MRTRTGQPRYRGWPRKEDVGNSQVETIKLDTQGEFGTFMFTLGFHCCRRVLRMTSMHPIDWPWSLPYTFPWALALFWLGTSCQKEILKASQGRRPWNSYSESGGPTGETDPAGRGLDGGTDLWPLSRQVGLNRRWYNILVPMLYFNGLITVPAIPTYPSGNSSARPCPTRGLPKPSHTLTLSMSGTGAFIRVISNLMRLRLVITYRILSGRR